MCSKKYFNKFTHIEYFAQIENFWQFDHCLFNKYYVNKKNKKNATQIRFGEKKFAVYKLDISK